MNMLLLRPPEAPVVPYSKGNALTPVDFLCNVLLSVFSQLKELASVLYDGVLDPCIF